MRGIRAATRGHLTLGGRPLLKGLVGLPTKLVFSFIETYVYRPQGELRAELVAAACCLQNQQLVRAVTSNIEILRLRKFALAHEVSTNHFRHCLRC